MEENLIGYLIDALDPQAQAEVEAHLKAQPQARKHLKLLRAGLAPLRADTDYSAPDGLVIATLGRVAACQVQERKERNLLPPGPPLARSEAGVPARPWFRRSDWLVAAVLLLMVGGLATTALVRLWRDSQRLTCANNLRMLWQQLQGYSDQNGGRFPSPDPEGSRAVAGAFVPILREAGFSITPAVLVCPGEGGPAPDPVTLRELEWLHRTNPEGFRNAARELAGCYAYSLGYAEGGIYYGPSRNLGDGQALLADRPNKGAVFPPEGNSKNHGGVGQNVLFVGGEVRWCVERTVGPAGDDIYLNHNRQVHAGLNANDTVLGASIATAGMK